MVLKKKSSCSLSRVQFHTIKKRTGRAGTSGLRSGLVKVVFRLSFEAGVDQNSALRAFLTARNPAFLCTAFLVHSTSFFASPLQI